MKLLIWGIILKTRGPHRSPEKPAQINIHIWEKLWLYLCQIWLNSGSREEEFFNFIKHFHYFVISPWKGWVLNLYKLETHLPKDALCQVWLKLTHWFWRRWWKSVKLTTTTTTTDNGQIFIRKAHLSLRLRWAKNSIRNGFLQQYHPISFIWSVVKADTHSLNV